MLKKHKIVLILVGVIAAAAAVLTVIPIVLTLRCVSSDIVISKFQKSIERDNTTKFERLLTDKVIAQPFDSGMTAYHDADDSSVLTERYHEMVNNIHSEAGNKAAFSWTSSSTVKAAPEEINTLTSKGYRITDCMIVTGTLEVTGNNTSKDYEYSLTIVKQGMYWYLADFETR